MILTEDEAKTKWCPETRIHEVRGAGVYVNKPITDENPHGHAKAASVLCIGSACMAWRTFQGVHPTDLKFIEPCDGYGYCGKAGRP